MSEDAKPLWLLDVDGVINAVCEMPREGYTHALNGFIRYRPALVDYLNRVHAEGSAEIRWLTTWCDQAPLELAPALGLPDWPVEGAADHLDPANHHQWWKSVVAQRLAEAEPDRLIIWTDDDLAYANSLGEIAWAKGNDRIVCVCPNVEEGLTDHQLHLISDVIGPVAVAALCTEASA